MRELEVIDSREQFIATVACAAEDVIIEAIETRGVAHVVLTGGTMGIAVLTGFGVGEQTRVDWSLVHFWWGDERFVTQRSSDRNAQQARDAFLARANVPEKNIHEMPSTDSGLSLDAAASFYENELAVYGNPSSLPRFDLTFLGIGPDSHVASLFPDHNDARRPGFCVPVRNSPKPPAERISLTFEALNTSDRIWVVACGADKAEAVSAMFSHRGNFNVPSSCVSGTIQTKVWADYPASSLVAEGTHR